MKKNTSECGKEVATNMLSDKLFTSMRGLAKGDSLALFLTDLTNKEILSSVKNTLSWLYTRDMHLIGDILLAIFIWEKQFEISNPCMPELY